MRTTQIPDSVVGDTVIEMKRGTDTVNAVRSALLQLAYAIKTRGQATRGILLIIEPKITDGRLAEEEKFAKMVLDPRIHKRLGIVIYRGGELRGLPEGMTLAVRRELGRLAGVELSKKVTKIHGTRIHYEILKILIHQWIFNKGPMTTAWLGKTVGCSYPPVANTLKRLGSTIKRHSDRRVELSYFPKDEWARLLAVSEDVRSTSRFADRSGQPRSSETHLRRLEKMNVSDLAVGGVIGAKHYYPDLDLVGTPRLDLSLHCPHGNMDLSFIEKLDPALKKVNDPLQPASVVVHAVRRKDPFFVRGKSVMWADPVECLLDLHESRLESQAVEFLRSLESSRKS